VFGRTREGLLAKCISTPCWGTSTPRRKRCSRRRRATRSTSRGSHGQWAGAGGGVDISIMTGDSAQLALLAVDSSVCETPSRGR
jgi:hypothetical protein